VNQTAPLIKMNGIGNKIVVVDMRLTSIPLEKAAVLHLAAQEETEFDQIMAILPPRTGTTDAMIEIWNRDGTRAGACGNGMRCVVAYLAEKGGAQKGSDGQIKHKFHFETASGFVDARYLGAGRVEVDMGLPAFDWRDIPTSRPLKDTLYVNMGLDMLGDATLVSMGNPHCIFFVEQDVDKIALEHYGAILEHDPLFVNRANISLARLSSPAQMQMRTWERGAGLTLACGTAACAAVVAAVRRGLGDRKMEVSLLGGKLQIEWAQSGHVLMVGETEYEFSGHVDPTNGHFVKN